MKLNEMGLETNHADQLHQVRRDLTGVSSRLERITSYLSDEDKHIAQEAMTLVDQARQVLFQKVR